jgi:hypothetical protein
MKALSVMVLQRSGAKEIKCNGCGRPVLVFEGEPPQISHQPPECAWFRTLMEKQAAGTVETQIGEVNDDVSN